jgi:hypothetical protein
MARPAPVAVFVHNGPGLLNDPRSRACAVSLRRLPAEQLLSRPVEHYQGWEGANAPTRHAITNAAMTTIEAAKKTTTRQIRDRSSVWGGLVLKRVGICCGSCQIG